MTRLAPLITGFLRDYMPGQRGYSPHTCETYAHSFRLLFAFAAKRIGTNPSQLHIEQLDAPLILDFLEYIERERRNGAVTRNLRLSAIKAFMRYLEYQLPAALEQIGRIPRHTDKAPRSEAHPAPDDGGGAGDPERARSRDPLGLARPGDAASVLRGSIARVGAGRRDADEPFLAANTEPSRPGQGPQGTLSASLEGNRGRLAGLAAVRGHVRAPELFVNADGRAMTRAGFEYVLDKHARATAAVCPSLRGRSVSPHQLRHSCAVIMLQATRDVRKVALWLGHADIRTTEVYLRMDATQKLEAVEAVIPPELRRGRFKAPDALIASLLEDASRPAA